MRVKCSDNDLALAAAGGDAAAFSTLLGRSYDSMFGLSFRLTGSRADAEDLTQDICAALPAKLTRFNGDSRFTTWLYRVVVNAAHDRRRRIATQKRATTGWGDWEIARRAENDEAAAQVDWLTQAMCALPDDLRDTIALVLDEITHRDVATILGVSEGTISWRVSEAKKRLRALRQNEDQL
ncbi:MAG: RNA polymerase sigma factor (sigma-70 family) [Paracoccaceae bacterium]|jgi:RNA polymerase sigma factor (sigma-70 family)